MFRTEYFKKADDVPEEIWRKFVNHNAVGLELNHLRAVELSGINNIEPFYIICYEDVKPVGIAYCFAINIDLSRILTDYPVESVNVVRQWKPDFMHARILEVGHITSLGPAISVSDAAPDEALENLILQIDEIAKNVNADLCVIRDMCADKFNSLAAITGAGYKPVMGFPAAHLKIEWNSFDEYMQSLKSKKRRAFSAKRKKLNVPEISVEIIEDYAPYSERLAELWTAVAIKQNGYEHEKLTPSFFAEMSRNLKGRSNVIAIKHKGVIAAFGLNLIGDEEYFAMIEGLDYDLRDSYDLYANLIFEGLKEACRLGKKNYNLGITSYDFKTSVGAELKPCVYFIKSISEPDYTEAYADMLRKNISQPANEHRVFSGEYSHNPDLLKETEKKIINNGSSKDVFTKHMRYYRADTARASGLYSFCPVFESAQEPLIIREGREVIMLGTNSYLGLATHPKVKAAAVAAIEKYGSGCSGSPMLNGTLDLHMTLSDEIAGFTGKEAALIFSTGYQTNVGLIQALVNRDDVLLLDERDHTSIVDGAVLSRAQIARYRHNNMGSLERLLKKYEAKPKLVVTDSLFSMEGTIVDLPEMIRLVRKYNARLLLDESHAIGVIGPGGRGVAELYGLTDEVDIIMGTFSKSLASIGGFAAGSRKIMDVIKHKAHSHLFSASLPPSAVAAVLAALDIVKNEPERRCSLISNSRFLAEGLSNLGYELGPTGSAIIPIFVGDELITMAAFCKLLEEGVFVNPVTYPAVPKKQEMLRVSVMATHTNEMLKRALRIFEKIRTPYWPYVNIPVVENNKVNHADR